MTVFCLGDEELFVHRSLWRYRRQRVFRRQDIRRLMQGWDGGKGQDSFPSWGLVIVTDKPWVQVLTRQPREKSAWLGHVLAEWASVPFEESAS